MPKLRPTPVPDFADEQVDRWSDISATQRSAVGWKTEEPDKADARISTNDISGEIFKASSFNPRDCGSLDPSLMPAL